MNIQSRIGLIRSLLIYNYKPFNKKRLRNFYSQFIKPGDLAFDIGALTGNRSNTWLNLGAKVVAVEPQPVLINFLRRKMGGHNNFDLMENVIGSKKGEVSLQINEAHPSVSTVSDEWTTLLKGFKKTLKWEKVIQVEMTTLDDMIEKYGVPNFCKIDVEGLEFEVLKGLSHTVPQLSFEFFPTTSDNTGQCLDLIDKLGSYKYNWILAETFKYQSEEWLTLKEIKSQISSYKGKKPGDIYCVHDD